MNPYSLTLWRRATRALSTARRLARDDPDAAASRAYYAAFYAVSALFYLEGKTFTKHSAVEVAVHRDLVHVGRWAPELGADFRDLHRLRAVGDYGGLEHVDESSALGALDRAQRILDAVRAAHPELATEEDPESDQP